MPITLGKLIEQVERWVEKAEEECKGRDGALRAHVCFDWGRAIPTTLDSYRGFYNQLALGYEAGGEYHATVRKTVGDFLTELKEAVGKEYTGWKGGEYTMNEETPVWVDNPGSCCGTAIVEVGMFYDHALHLQTAQEDW